MQNIPGATNSGMRSLEADKRVQSDHLTMSVALSERQPCLLHTGGTGFHASRAVSSTWGWRCFSYSCTGSGCMTKGTAEVPSFVL